MNYSNCARQCQFKGRLRAIDRNALKNIEYVQQAEECRANRQLPRNGKVSARARTSPVYRLNATESP